MNDAVGYFACLLVLATFSMRSMKWLRMVAMTSNIAFIVYALTAKLWPILVLHSILLPMNLIRLLQLGVML